MGKGVAFGKKVGQTVSGCHRSKGLFSEGDDGER